MSATANTLARDPGHPHHRPRLRRAWAEHLAMYEWHTFATLTSAAPIPAVLAEFLNGFVRRLAHHAQQGIRWACVKESGTNNHVHLHALLHGTARIPLRLIRRCWRIGFADVREYQRECGVEYYLTKELDEAGDFSIETSRIMPPHVGGSR